MGVAINDKNLPGIPQWDRWDFFKWSLIILDTSIGDVFIVSTEGMLGFFGKYGTSSSGFGTVDFEAKCLLSKSLFVLFSDIVCPFSSKGGIDEYFLLFSSLVRIENFSFCRNLRIIHSNIYCIVKRVLDPSVCLKGLIWCYSWIFMSLTFFTL